MARRRRRGGGDREEGHGGNERWLVSYADFITLMFVVFTVLFSMARLDVSKYEVLAGSLRQSMGPVGPTVATIPTRGHPGQAVPIRPADQGNLPDLPDWPAYLIGPPPDDELALIERALIPPAETPPETAKPSPVESDPVAPPPPPPPPDPLSDLAQAFQSLVGSRNSLISIALEEQGLVLSIAGSLLFAPGETKLLPEAQSYLNEVATRLVGIELPIMVKGTVDESPLPEQTLSSWDLAALRAGSVVHYLITEQGLSSSSFITIGSVGDAEQVPDVAIVVMRRAAFP